MDYTVALNLKKQIIEVIIGAIWFASFAVLAKGIVLIIGLVIGVAILMLGFMPALVVGKNHFSRRHILKYKKYAFEDLQYWKDEMKSGNETSSGLDVQVYRFYDQDGNVLLTIDKFEKNAEKFKNQCVEHGVEMK